MSKRHLFSRRRVVLPGISLFLGSVVLSSFAVVGRSPSSTSPVPPRTHFRMSLASEPPTLDWSLATDSVSFDVITNIMEGLTEYDPQLIPRPAIARRWEVSPDGKRYTFFLRDDVVWSDGKPVSAHDFEYSWKRLLNPTTAAEYAYFLYDVVNAYEYNSGRVASPDLVGVKAVSPTVLQVTLKKPIVYFPSITTFMVTFPQRKDVIERYGDRWTEPEHIVTNGPFRLHQWRHEYKVVLTANGLYYGGRPALDMITFFVVNERTTALTLYETGDLDLVSLPPEAIPSSTMSPQYRSHPLLRGYYYGFNVTKKPFDDVRVRQAFSMAVDREELPRILKGGEIPTASWIPRGMMGYNPRLGLPFQPGRARQLLAEAGYPQGKGFPPVTVVFNTDPVNTLIAENIQAQWKRNLGVAVTLDNQEWKVFLKRLKTDPPQIFRLGWGADYPDPDNFMALFTATSGNNNTTWVNPRYDELIARAASERDPARRRALYDEAQRILTEQDVPIMPLFVSVQNLLVKPFVRGFEPNAMELLYLKKLSFEGH